MVAKRLPIGHTLRLAVIRKVGQTFVECDYLGHVGEKSFQCPTPYPYGSRGGGFLVGPERDTVVLVANGPSERQFIVGTVPDRQYYDDQSGVEDTPFSFSRFPSLEEGALMMKSGPSGSYISLDPDGNLRMDVGVGDAESDIELSPFSKALFFRVDNKYSFTEASRNIEGVIRRNVNVKENPLETGAFSFLSGEGYDSLLSSIGRSPDDEVQNRTTKIARDFTRNPALVEKREIVYEYANSFGVQNLTAESSAMITTENTNGVENLIRSSGARANRRTDILNLNMFNYNHLIEKVEGTVVDIYGNILDINRNIVDVPDIGSLNTKTAATENLKNLYRFLRRSIKYHLEINSRKEIEDDEPTRDNSRAHSRWSIDVDGEGLTKVNIPASSDTGNIPVLGRYLTSIPPDTSNRASGSYKDSKSVDVRMAQFGAQDGDTFTGQQITNSAYTPETFDNKSVSTAGTAYHDLLSVVPLIFSEGKWGDLLDVDDPSVMSSQIHNKIGVDPNSTDAPNAGGRSVHANLDGSLEMSIGADSVDKKSVVLDLEGGMISQFGRDKNGRSIIHQSDGDVLIQIGGKPSSADDAVDRPGRLEIHLNTGEGKPSQKIVIDENGLTIDVQGNALFNASGDISIVAGARLLMQGEMNFLHGSADTDIKGTRAIQGTERLVIRNGVPNHM